MKGYYVDPDTSLVQEQFAVVFAPRRQRERFPEGCVEVMSTEEQALDSADPDKKRYAAVVLGPARSSEGLSLYYLVKWLAE